MMVGSTLGGNSFFSSCMAATTSRSTVSELAPGSALSSVVGFDDDVGELLGRGQPAERFDVDLISFVARARRLVQDTGRDLKILRAQRGEHVAGGEIVGRRLVRVEPDAHCIFAAALELQ